MKLKIFTGFEPSQVEKQFNEWVPFIGPNLQIMSVTTNVSPMHELVPGSTPCVDRTWQEFTTTVVYTD